MNDLCEYCGLPVPKPWWGRPAADRPNYCCFGCKFAHAVTRESGEAGVNQAMLARLGIAIFFALNVMAFTMALWAEDLYGPDAIQSSIRPVLHSLFRHLCLVFSIPVMFLLGAPLATNAWRTLKNGAPSTDLLLLTGVAGSFLLSVIAILRDHGPVYFEVGVAVLVLVTLGRWLEATGKHRATEALGELQRLLPATARLLRNHEQVEMPLSNVRVGDRLRVLAGERIPCDGRVIRFSASVDEQFTSGESTPVHKEPGDSVWGGGLALDGELIVEVIAPPDGGALARIITSIQQAAQSKGRYERMADRAASAFLPLVAIISLAVAAYQGTAYGPEQGLLAGLSVLVIACPCALGVATPLVVWVVIGRLAQRGVLLRSGDALERLASVRAILFDKTGTLTIGTPTVAEFHTTADDSASEVLAEAARLATASIHPHSLAIARFAATRLSQSDPRSWDGIRTLPGRGVSAPDGPMGPALLGSVRLMQEQGVAIDAVTMAHVDAGWPVVCLAYRGAVRGLFVVKEQIRPDARPALNRLATLGLKVGVLTGDQSNRARELQQQLDVWVVAGLLPDEKVIHVQAVRTQYGPTAMVGDGINDAPALAVADVGIAMGCGADVSRETASVCLLSNQLSSLVDTVEFAKSAIRVIRQNLFWAFIYNAIGIGFACTGRLNPVLAATAMIVSSGIVVANSWRLAADSKTRPAVAEQLRNAGAAA